MIKINKSIKTRDELASPPRWRQKINSTLVRVPITMKADVMALIEGRLDELKVSINNNETNHKLNNNTITETINTKDNECSCKVLGYDKIGLPIVVECYYCKTLEG